MKSFAIEANICKRWKSKIPGLAVFWPGPNICTNEGKL